MKKLLVVGMLIAASAASADTVDVSVRQGVAGKQMPAIQIRILERIAGFHLTLKRNDGKEIDVKGGGAPGVTRVIDLDQPDGKFTYSGQLDINMPNADVMNMPLQFDTEMYGPLRLTIDKDKDVDLKQRTFRYAVNRPISKVKIEVVDETGATAYEKEVPVSGDELKGELGWPETAKEVIKISVTAYDTNGFYSGVNFFPLEVFIQHEEVVFDTGKWDVRPDQSEKLAEPLADLKRRIGLILPHYPPGTAKLYVIGYTDTVGDKASNRTLSLNRARAIGAWFKKNGMSLPILYEGFGEDALKVPTRDETPEERNRRADYVLSVGAPHFDGVPFEPRWQKL